MKLVRTKQKISKLAVFEITYLKEFPFLLSSQFRFNVKEPKTSTTRPACPNLRCKTIYFLHSDKYSFRLNIVRIGP